MRKTANEFIEFCRFINLTEKEKQPIVDALVKSYYRNEMTYAEFWQSIKLLKPI